MEHLLGTPWTFYYYEKKKYSNTTEKWGKSIKTIAYIETIENFWAVYSRLRIPSKLPTKNSFIQYHFFRNHCRAMWEDESNANGGIFTIEIPHHQLDLSWERLLLALIGERINPDVNGVVIKGNHISVWTRTSADLALRQKIADQIFTNLDLPFKTQIRYVPNEKVMERDNFSTTYIYEADGAKLIPNENIPS